MPGSGAEENCLAVTPAITTTDSLDVQAADGWIGLGDHTATKGEREDTTEANGTDFARQKQCHRQNLRRPAVS